MGWNNVGRRLLWGKGPWQAHSSTVLAICHQPLVLENSLGLGGAAEIETDLALHR